MKNNPTLIPGSTYTLKAGCKVNLYLKITNILPNGWHELDSLFIPISEPYDKITITVDPKKQDITVYCDTIGIDSQNNTLTKAYQYYAETTGFSPPISLHLEKGIPHGSGLGGGSSDAATLLLWLQQYAPNPLAPEELSSLACKVGADTPFFLKNAPCKVSGIGERIEPIQLKSLPISGNTLVLILPDIQINTPWAYKNWDEWFFKQKTASNNQQPLTKKHTQGRSSNLENYKNIFRLDNDFEPSIFAVYPVLRQYKEKLLKSGARAAALSGSGASIWSLFTDSTKALDAAKDFQNKNIKAIYHTL